MLTTRAHARMYARTHTNTLAHSHIPKLKTTARSNLALTFHFRTWFQKKTARPSSCSFLSPSEVGTILKTNSSPFKRQGAAPHRKWGSGLGAPPSVLCPRSPISSGAQHGVQWRMRSASVGRVIDLLTEKNKFVALDCGCDLTLAGGGGGGERGMIWIPKHLCLFFFFS